MIPVSSSYNLQGMSTLNFNNLLSNTNQTQATLPISALGNILQLHCNPSLTLQVNGPSPLIPVSNKDTTSQEQINSFRSIFPNQPSYQNISQHDQCTNTSSRGINQIIQDLLNTYQTQQDSLSQVTIKYNFLLNAMERLLFDVQNSVEYSLLALGISQTISKVKLNQLNQLNQLNCTSLIPNGLIPMISQSHIFNNCTQTTKQPMETIQIPSIIDLTNQRPRSASVTGVSSTDKKSETSHTESINSTNTTDSKPMKMTSLDKLDKLIDETVKKTTGKKQSIDDDSVHSNSKPVSDDNQPPSAVDVNVNMGSAIHQIIRQFYQNASLSMNNVVSVGNSFTDSNLQRLQTDHLKNNPSSFNQQVTEVTANSQVPFNSLGNHQQSPSFILCNNVSNNSPIKGAQLRESCALSSLGHDATEDTDSISNHDGEELIFSELDPTEVATRIRDILSLHSIGQRLFAKHVLNLSQGTVSELLSKPKPWSKLSEKGRDSYRKMSQWAQDAGKVQELKSIAPRKGFSGHYAGMSPATPIKDDHETQEKIKRILNDAKMAMASTNNQSSIEEEIFSCYSKPCDAPISKLTNDCSPLSNMICSSVLPVNNPIPNVLEFDISQLQKKFAAALQSIVVSNSSRPEAGPATTAIITTSSIATTTTYQQSPLIVMNLAGLVPCSSSLIVSPGQQSHSRLFPVISTNISSDNNDDTGEEMDCISNKLFPVNKKESVVNETEIEIYVDRARVTEKSFGTKLNSDELDSSNTMSSKSTNDMHNLKNVMTSIVGSVQLTENCFQNEEFNTSELVNVIKDHLTKNSISQRTFGYLLGLSQGTVSDILSRPKQWSVLTNKGREPYIRMLKYLLKPTYYKPIENGTQKTSTNQNAAIESMPNSSCSPSSSDMAMAYEQSMAYGNKNDEGDISSSTEGREYHSADEEIPNIDIEQFNSQILNLDQLQMENVKYDDSQDRIFSIATRIVSIDIEELIKNISNTLENHKITLELFGESILNLSNNSVRDLFSKPKTWDKLNLKGREPYVRMHLWSQHPDKLRLLFKAIESPKDQSTIKPNQSNATLLTDNCKMKSNFKRTRVIFTDFQKLELRRVYEKYQYPKSDQLHSLSKRLNLTTTTIGNWFHNQRIRVRGQSSTNENHQNVIVNKIEPSLSGESEINSEKSLPMKVEDIFDGSEDSDNSISAPHLYPESSLQEYGLLNDKNEDEERNENYSQLFATVAGSNKRKRTNPIKLEMVNKTSNKDADDADNSSNRKIQKLDQSHL